MTTPMSEAVLYAALILASLNQPGAALHHPNWITAPAAAVRPAAIFAPAAPARPANLQRARGGLDRPRN